MNNIGNIEIEENASLKNLNTYKIESTCKYLIKVKSIEELIDVLKYLKDNKIKYFILGGGSNIILDDYFDGAIIKLAYLNKITIKDLEVEAEAGVMLGRLAQETVKSSLTGLEWAINIPGTLGGSITGNAGAYKSEMFDNIVEIKVLNENYEVLNLKKEDIKYSYRSTNIKALKFIVLSAKFKLEKGRKEESLDLIRDRQERRSKSQPLNYPSAGSVFRNPEGDFAGRLIEEVGLKGMQIGGAQVSTKHANFIVNVGNATGNDIKNLIELVREKVKEKFGIELVLEQEIVDWS